MSGPHVAVIPARGGSKRVPRKNIKLFRGKPMIAWAIEAAKASGIFSNIVVSTDDDEIASTARAFGAQTPFVRPPHLADDLTPTVPVIAHAVQVCQSLGWEFDRVCCIYPCVPTLQSTDLVAALSMSLDRDADFVYPVTDYPHPIQRAMRKSPEGKMELFQPEYEMTRTQDLERSFHDAGQFYVGKWSSWLANMRMHTAGLGMPIPHWRVVDIDSEDDWKRAELIVQALAESS